MLKMRRATCCRRIDPILVTATIICFIAGCTAASSPPTHIPGGDILRGLAQHAVASTENGTYWNTAARLVERAVDQADGFVAKAPEAGNFTANVAGRLVQELLGPEHASELYTKFCKGAGKTALVGASFVPTFLAPGLSNIGSCLLLACDVATNSYNGAAVELTGCLPIPMGKYMGSLAANAMGRKTFLGTAVRTMGRLVDFGPMALRVLKRLMQVADHINAVLGVFRKNV